MRVVVSALAGVPLLVAWIAVGQDPALAESPWPVAIAAAVPGIAVIAWQRKRWVLLVVAFALAAVAGFASGRARALLDLADDDTAWPSYDLRDAPLPDDAPAFLEVTGYFRGQWRLSEYAVPEGELPDQSSRADAVLVPFVGSLDDVIATDGLIVLARIDADDIVDGTKVSSIRGKLGPLDPSLLHTVVQAPAGARGVTIDTLQRPRPREAWTNVAIAVIVALLAFACLWFATMPDRGEADRPQDR